MTKLGGGAAEATALPYDPYNPPPGAIAPAELPTPRPDPPPTTPTRVRVDELHTYVALEFDRLPSSVRVLDMPPPRLRYGANNTLVWWLTADLSPDNDSFPDEDEIHIVMDANSGAIVHYDQARME